LRQDEIKNTGRRDAAEWRTANEWRGGLAKLKDDIDRLLSLKKRVTVAFDGMSASGKTSLAAVMEELYSCNIIHMDDFFLQDEQRTPERLAAPGGNIDHERFNEEVARNLIGDAPFSYRPYDCKTKTLAPPVKVLPNRLTIIEGVYSMHPAIARFAAYDLRVFFMTDKSKQLYGLQKRNPALLSRFVNEWIPMESRYFEHFDIQANCAYTLYDIHDDIHG